MGMNSETYETVIECHFYDLICLPRSMRISVGVVSFVKSARLPA